MPIKKRETAIAERVEQMRNDTREWRLFQDFCCMCLAHLGYTDLRKSAEQSDFGRDAVAITPDGRPCFVAVSFECSLSKIKSDAKRWTEDTNREPAEVMVFVSWDARQEIQISEWKGEVQAAWGLELRVIHQETLLATAARAGVWRETRDLLGVTAVREGYTCIAPYDSDAVRQAMNVRPREILEHPLSRRELAGERDWQRNVMAFGKPGAGKTTTLYQILEKIQPERTFIVERNLQEHAQIEDLLDAAGAEGGVIVFDDIQERPRTFAQFCEQLLAIEPGNVILFTSSRSTEWEEVQKEVSPAYLDELGLVGAGVLRLSDLEEAECRQLIEMCRDEWGLDVEDRIVGQAATKAAEGDASPLYVISLLAPARAKEDREVSDADVAAAPGSVRELWCRYFASLSATGKSALRLVKLFWCAKVEPQRHLVDAAAGPWGLNVTDTDDALDHLATALWIDTSQGAPRCLDVQLEAIALAEFHYARWDAFVREFGGARGTHLQLLNGTSVYYYLVRRPTSAARAAYLTACSAALANWEQALGLARAREERSGFLSNASACYAELAVLEPTLEGRRAQLDKAVEYAEEAVGIYRQLGLQADLAMSLNNASNRYSALAGLEPTSEGRRAQLDKAAEYAEEAIGIYRQLGLQANLATSLNNASTGYSALAGQEPTLEGRRAQLDKAAEYAEEAIGIYRQLGQPTETAMSLGSASRHYRALADAETDPIGKGEALGRSLECACEAIGLFRDAGVTEYWLMALMDGIHSATALADHEQGPIDLQAIEWAEEGQRAAEQYGDKDRAEAFAGVKAKLGPMD